MIKANGFKNCIATSRWQGTFNDVIQCGVSWKTASAEAARERMLAIFVYCCSTTAFVWGTDGEGQTLTDCNSKWFTVQQSAHCSGRKTVHPCSRIGLCCRRETCQSVLVKQGSQGSRATDAGDLGIQVVVGRCPHINKKNQGMWDAVRRWNFLY